MTKSQLKSIVGGAAAALGTLDAQMHVLAAVLPPKWAGWLRAVVIIGGVIVMLFNQSLSTAHVSLPVEEAKELAERLRAQREGAGAALGTVARLEKFVRGKESEK